VEGRSVVEFGPGSGYNAIYTGSLKPGRYVLVDANPVGLNETRELLQKQFGNTLSYEMAPSLIEDFETDERFDISICEGTIPFQLFPEEFTRKVASFCKPGGVVIITCAAAASCIGEIARRLIASRIVAKDATLPEKLALLRPVFAPHLAMMTNMSRSVDHWILDNIIHPFIGKTFAIDAAIDALGDEFEVYGQSPQFIEDWRWYKDVWGAATEFNARAKASYFRNIANFLDYHIEVPPHSVELGERVSGLADSLYGLMQDYELRGIDGAIGSACNKLLEIANAVATISPITAESLREAAGFVSGTSDDLRSFTSFESYFGRGQQYLSFIRRAS
jgi:SAM-dependent methyltransferase